MAKWHPRGQKFARWIGAIPLRKFFVKNRSSVKPVTQRFLVGDFMRWR